MKYLWLALFFSTLTWSAIALRGYERDTQTDMALALLGAITALITLGRFHDRQLSEL